MIRAPPNKAQRPNTMDGAFAAAGCREVLRQAPAKLSQSISWAWNSEA